MSAVLTPKATASKAKPRVLIVDDEPALLQLMNDIVAGGIDCQLVSAKGVKEAARILETQTIDLLVTDVNLPDGSGISLVPKLKAKSPTASAVVVTGDASVIHAVSAMRSGADDFVCKPFNADQLLDRVTGALKRRDVADRAGRRVAKLRDAVKKLNASRKTVSKKVDLLCNDLVTAYGEIAKQLDEVRTSESFRKTLTTAGDLEQLLCHAMDWMLKELGYTNVAIWLAADDGDFQLGAYMKYTLAGDKPLTDALQNGLVARATKDEFVHVTRDNMHDTLTEDEIDLLADQNLVAANCAYLGESLGTVVLFRDARSPFSADDLETVKAIAPLFATALASIVKRTGDIEDADGDSDLGSMLDADTDTTMDPKPNKKRPDDADWWKRGDRAPF